MEPPKTDWSNLGLSVLVCVIFLLGIAIVTGCAHRPHGPRGVHETNHTWVRDHAGWDNRYSSYADKRPT